MAKKEAKKAAANPPAAAPKKPAEPEITEIRLLAGKVLHDGPGGLVYGQPGDVVRVPAECHPDRARVLVKAGFAELV